MRAVCKRKGDTALVSLSGELDHHGAAAVLDKLKACAEDGAVSTLVVDMSKVTFMDSSGIGALLGRYRTMAEKRQNGAEEPGRTDIQAFAHGRNGQACRKN